MTRPLCFFFALVLAGCSAAAAQSGGCHRDADCTLVDVCGCECHAMLGPEPPPPACSEACGGHPCVGHRAVCANGTCVMR
jgi:hypothetical protein